MMDYPSFHPFVAQIIYLIPINDYFIINDYF
jgi:hypothetical protein